MTESVLAMGWHVMKVTPRDAPPPHPLTHAINVTGTVLGVAAGVGAAMADFGYWALVFQFLAMCAVKAAGSWIASDWRPSWVSVSDPRAAPGLRKLMSYGKDVTAGGLIKHLGRNVDRIIVGYMAGPQALGLYHHADKWAHFPVRQLYAPLRSVAVSGLSRVQDDADLYRRYVRLGLLPVFAVTMPAVAFLFAEADRVIALLLGAQWMEAVPLFRILCVAAFVGKITTVTRWLYLSAGETRRQLHWDLISAPVMVAAVAIGSIWGVRGVALGFTAANLALVYPSIWYCLRRSHVSMRDFAGIVWRPMVASVIAAATLLLVEHFAQPQTHAIAFLAMQLAVFGVAYAVSWLVLPGGTEAARDLSRLSAALSGKRRAAMPPGTTAAAEAPDSVLGG